MKKIESFTIDHTRLKRGVYVSRRDAVGDSMVTTFDLRMKEPNNEPALSSAAAHTLEHIGATFLRNHAAFSSRIVYFGPMGCLTGFYLLVSGNTDSKTIAPLIQELFKYTSEFEGTVPGASPVECGNYMLMDLLSARLEALKYYNEVLDGIGEENLVYPA
ncbi:S-ribosylhomocysteine lyase [Desulfosediminicola flagellatus]|uniref:S-ribosylhomocysteine lyase n=1 Tax=Desulfosediminicola flagellatus TaxID=2569541 RepID=UPI0010ABD384|nr:S-ribosylhomocysteine lyase [Desulfosediminicola flagellatus]